jgi:hypothetical protein
MQFPSMAPVKQHFPSVAEKDVVGSVVEQLRQADLKAAIAPGARIAVSTGSRGITDIDRIVRAVVDCLKEAGGEPFILPAMGSHGGGTPEGQKKVLEGYGITPESMGVPIEATMEVIEVDRLKDGTPVLVNRLALEADGIVLVNRIKPHTSFRGPFESGLMKMMTIGLGSHKGATIAHSKGAQGLAKVIPAWGKSILEKAPILMGLGIIENAYDETARLVALKPEEFISGEPKLLEEAREAMPRILVQAIDLLIVEEIGKDISGTGMDTNVVGRMMLPGIKEPEVPGVSRIVVLDLTERTHGNASGMGLADIITRRLFDKIDYKSTYANVFTSTFLNRAYIPVIMETDREAIAAALQVLGLEDSAQARVVRIKNTLSMAAIQISAPLLNEFGSHPHLEQAGPLAPMAFAEDGSLI